MLLSPTESTARQTASGHYSVSQKFTDVHVNLRSEMCLEAPLASRRGRPHAHSRDARPTPCRGVVVTLDGARYLLRNHAAAAAAAADEPKHGCAAALLGENDVAKKQGRAFDGADAQHQLRRTMRIPAPRQQLEDRVVLVIDADRVALPDQRCENNTTTT